MLDIHFVILGALIAFGGTLRYVIDTLKGTTSPNRVTWFIWTLAPMIAFAAEIKSGVGLLALTTFMAGFCPLMVLIASFINRNAVWKLSRFDVICGLLSLLGLALWLRTGQGNLAIIFGIAADGLAALPTIVKAYYHPESETWVGYFASAINAAITILTITVWTFAHYAFPVYLLTVCVLLTILIRVKPQKRYSL